MKDNYLKIRDLSAHLLSKVDYQHAKVVIKRGGFFSAKRTVELIAVVDGKEYLMSTTTFYYGGAQVTLELPPDIMKIRAV